ncbi:entericidin, EcnA/B family [Rhodobacteraceae bacterium W635]|uniref:entericidin A/B family lipoprotein n=1 Tax=Nioella halotolerans TaxID=2303578 RepID=UPI000E3C1B52|nr:entericidin, EcnA/B family [Rhodobacteraceae bacterium W635]
MKTPKLSSLTLIAVTLSGALALQACNTVEGIGRDVSAGGNAVAGAADENREY